MTIDEYEKGDSMPQGTMGPCCNVGRQKVFLPKVLGQLKESLKEMEIKKKAKKRVRRRVPRFLCESDNFYRYRDMAETLVQAAFCYQNANHPKAEEIWLQAASAFEEAVRNMQKIIEDGGEDA
jgi:hypothetical protein